MFSLIQYPLEIICKIIEDIDTKDLYELFCTCKYFNSIKFGVLVDKYGYELLQKSLLQQARLGNKYSLQSLIDNGVDVNYQCTKYKDTSLIIAADYGHIEVVKLLLNNNANITLQDTGGFTALIWAAVRNHENIVQYILGACTHIQGYNNTQDKYGQTALTRASSKGFNNIVNILLNNKGVDINIVDIANESALIKAASQNHIKIVKYLLTKGSELNVNIKDKYGKTALIRAAHEGHYEIIDLLLSEGFNIDVNARDKYGKTALIRAALKGHVEVVKSLVKYKNININIRDEYNRSALITASEHNHADIVKILLQCDNINVNFIDDYGETALMKAAVSLYPGRQTITKLLLQHHNIDVNIKNKTGHTALLKASLSGNFNIENIIKEYLYNNVCILQR